MTRTRAMRVARTVASRIRGRSVARYSHSGEEHVIGRLLATLDAPRFCVDIGAGDGRTMSNSLAL